MISLPYGRSSIELPDLWSGRAKVLSPGPFPDPDPEKTVREAIDNPLGGVVLDKICRSGCKVACVIPDLTRRASVRKYLPPLLEKLSEAGVYTDDITIIVALGIHRPLIDHELETLVGKSIRRKYRVVNHDPDKKESNIYVGTTDAGIPVKINRGVAEADCVILTGSVTYHYFAGYGGGRKSLLPGVSSREACETHHKMVVSWRRGELKGKLGPGELEDNPAHWQMVQACGFVPSIFVLNVVTDPGGRIIAASAGELEAAHTELCRKHELWFRRELENRFPLVIAAAGGYPKDVNFVQAHKGLFSAHQAVSGEGAVIFVARCPEGAGHPDMLGWFDRCKTEREWLDDLQTRYQINGQTAFSTWLRVTSIPTVFVSDMEHGDVRRMGMVPASDMERALHEVKRILGKLPVPVIIPDAGDILPVVGSPKPKGQSAK
jgi:nickel-dependent lactate racemase